MRRRVSIAGKGSADAGATRLARVVSVFWHLGLPDSSPVWGSLEWGADADT
jgi:hypothetical protein